MKIGVALKWARRRGQTELGAFTCEESADEQFVRTMEERREKIYKRKRVQELQRRKEQLERKEKWERERGEREEEMVKLWDGKEWRAAYLEKKDHELKMREQDLKRREEELEQDLERRELELKMREQDLKRKEEELQRDNKILKEERRSWRREQELNSKEKELERKEKQLEKNEKSRMEQEERSNSEAAGKNTYKGSNHVIKTSEAEVVASAERLAIDVGLTVTKVFRKLELLYRRTGVGGESLEMLGKLQEEERREQEDDHKLQKRNLVFRMVFERREMKARIEAALAGRAEKDSCSTEEEMTRCLEHLRNLNCEKDELENGQVQRLGAMQEQQQLAKTQTKEQQRASTLAQLQDPLCLSPVLARAASLRRGLALLTSRPATLQAPACPVCLESLHPPTRIVQCGSGHLVCLQCTARLDRFECPTCRQQLAGRATAMEQLLAELFCHDQLEGE